MTLRIKEETSHPDRVADQGSEPVEAPAVDAKEPEILAEILVEELSIDGMCGVY